MTARSYTETPADGIDATHLVGAQLTGADRSLFKRYQDAFHLAVYWPDVEHFRACVRAYDAMIGGAQE